MKISREKTFEISIELNGREAGVFGERSGDQVKDSER